MGFSVGLLLPQPLVRIEDEPDAVQREIESGRRGVAGAVDGLRVLVAAEHLDRLILDAVTMDFDHRVGTIHVQTPWVPQSDLRTLYPQRRVLSQPRSPAMNRCTVRVSDLGTWSGSIRSFSAS